ncbi:hypothetical protein [Pedobacter steynii]|uniref:DUF4352 domain-containing protein n=1 Tax=Pedobacter steynii TaxID=430522 RepID=A0A1D7QDL6_9SPHI|nr:hypothetical protein [Pedobacter steynii]AOM76705.1 hypothetical protein BFS30_05740 [Pedobacter steynii]
MNKQFLRLSIVALGLLSFAACKNKDKKTGDAADSTLATQTTETAASTTPAPVGNEPLAYMITASPDSALLGKKSEALIKILESKGVALQDADGKSSGMQVTIKLSVTNKSTVGKEQYFTVNYSDARLQLDNNTSVAPEGGTGSSSPQPETTSEAEWTFKVPANAKPKKLSLFMDETRVAVDLRVEEKK